RLDTIPGFLPGIGEDLPGCVFVDRCALAEDRCRTEEPVLHDISEGHVSRCHFHDRASSLPRVIPPNLDHEIRIDRTQEPLVKVEELTKIFRQHGANIHALSGVSAYIWPGETLGLVGESGSGKTTFARTMLGIVPATAGSVELNGRVLQRALNKRKQDE